MGRRSDELQRRSRVPFGQIQPRQANVFAPAKTFLIVCEGAKTEPHYFEGFRLPPGTVYGLGKNTRSLVEAAIQLKAKYPDRDCYWCVFDRDSFPAQTFNAALELARQSEFSVAYTNEAFELWYLLHFDYHDAALSRRQYEGKLADRLGHPYRKNSETMYDELLGRQQQAVRNAARLLQQHAPHNPEKDNPCTSVHLLVQALNERNSG